MDTNRRFRSSSGSMLSTISKRRSNQFLADCMISGRTVLHFCFLSSCLIRKMLFSHNIKMGFSIVGFDQSCLCKPWADLLLAPQLNKRLGWAQGGPLHEDCARILEAQGTFRQVFPVDYHPEKSWFHSGFIVLS